MSHLQKLTSLGGRHLASSRLPLQTHRVPEPTLREVNWSELACERFAFVDGSIRSRPPFLGSELAFGFANQGVPSADLFSIRRPPLASSRFVYSMINTGMGLCVLPQEADRLNNAAGSLWASWPEIETGRHSSVTPFGAPVFWGGGSPVNADARPS